MSGVPQSDLRKTNLLVDETLLVRNKLVAADSEFANITFHSGTVNLQEVITTSIDAKQLVISGTSTTTATNGNLLFTQTPSSILAGQVPEFTTNGSTQVRGVAKSTVTGSTLSYFFSDGSDGNVTISGGTTTLTRDMYYDTLTIDSTGVLIPAGFVIFCKTALINNGLIHMNGGNGAAAAAGVGGAGGTPATSSGGLISGQAGGAGANTTLSAASVVASGTLLGGSGGAGADTTVPSYGGAIKFITNYVNGATFLGNIGLLPFLFRINSTAGILLGGIPGGGGSGGGGGATGGGGGGGAGGGWIMIIAREISGTGRFESKGGNGGNGAAAGGGAGGGGGGGVVYCLSLANSISSLQVVLTGGTAGTVFGSGLTSARNGDIGVYQNNLLTS